MKNLKIAPPTPSLAQVEETSRLAAAAAYADWKKDPSLVTNISATCALTAAIYASEALAAGGGAISDSRIAALNAALTEIDDWTAEAIK